MNGKFNRMCVKIIKFEILGLYHKKIKDEGN